MRLTFSSTEFRLLRGASTLWAIASKRQTWPEMVIVDLVLTIVEHRSLVKVFCVNPLQWDPCRRHVLGRPEGFAPLDFKLKAISHITGCMYLYPNIRVVLRAHSVRPMMFEGCPACDVQFKQKRPYGSCWWHRWLWNQKDRCTQFGAQDMYLMSWSEIWWLEWCLGFFGE